ncbi:hypothetical protein [Staphylococcus lugdunensis]|uniref:hypothetical protein n=1 Tax=Staphylococcus lugdunensis TaxID=28035 RepID=UPI0002994F83|nr:hypothetical protein [Staphylococcus lugdunensis]EKS23788.1 hypothetical protein HMPREF9308_01472 [Staphylococcus lugdunensis ACS-027-V-Sch2]QEX25348.1 hypothetical protein FO459_00100 [Staphylococcus lugdunensis]QEX27664.1 hypothetical protein FO459_12660 [Staphylococcus lugdunensis]QEX37245.1 hypothetical protein FO455_12445 [Staphylococcus lugdunensis]QEX37298.1 hypothetical protein FO455_12735 [Staphylococcus lugdunensis]
MNKLYKTPLLITMAVVTWKVWRIGNSKPTLGEVYRRHKPELPTVTLNKNGLFINDFRVPYVLEEGVNVKKSMNNLYTVSLVFFAKRIIADNYEADNPENQQLF